MARADEIREEMRKGFFSSRRDAARHAAMERWKNHPRPPQEHTIVQLPDGTTAVASSSGNVRIVPKPSIPRSPYDTSRRLDKKMITWEERQYIAAGKNGPDRVRRRNEIIDKYEREGKRYNTGTPRRKRRGGKDWLGR